MPSPIAQQLETELTVMRKLGTLVPAEVSAAIEARVQQLLRLALHESSLAGAQNVALPIVTVPLVRRPGLPPRPLDSFFFEIIRKP